mmetsp:Transcript_32804/g.77766  ORF Transcript_32804/g.77766 Transcript_32804/m.77766 type:complete len:226 (-) Transcript_32804:1174-1851(-)
MPFLVRCACSALSEAYSKISKRCLGFSNLFRRLLGLHVCLLFLLLRHFMDALRRIVLGDTRSRHLPCLQRVPVEAFEPLVLLDVLGTAAEHAKALCWLADKQAKDQVFGCLRHVWGELDVPVFVHDSPHDNHGVICLGGAERLSPSKKHVHQYTKAPPIHRVVVPVGKDIFRSHVTGCPAKGVGALPVLQHLGETKVSQLDVAPVIDKHVLRLEIAVNCVVLVQV